MCILFHEAQKDTVNFSILVKLWMRWFEEISPDIERITGATFQYNAASEKWLAQSP